MKPYNDNIVTFRSMLHGLDASLVRLDAAILARDPAAAFSPLFEALNWAVALDDRIGAHWAPAGQPLGKRWRHEVETAGVVPGVRYARNRVHHQWADALVLRDGLPFPISFPIQFFGWVWRRVDELPEGKNDEGVDVYRDRMQDQPAHEVLVEVQRACHWVGGLLEPSLAESRAPTDARAGRSGRS